MLPQPLARQMLRDVAFEEPFAAREPEEHAEGHQRAAHARRHQAALFFRHQEGDDLVARHAVPVLVRRHLGEGGKPFQVPLIGLHRVDAQTALDRKVIEERLDRTVDGGKQRRNPPSGAVRLVDAGIPFPTKATIVGVGAGALAKVR